MTQAEPPRDSSRLDAAPHGWWWKQSRTTRAWLFANTAWVCCVLGFVALFDPFNAGERLGRRLGFRYSTYLPDAPLVGVDEDFCRLVVIVAAPAFVWFLTSLWRRFVASR